MRAGSRQRRAFTVMVGGAACVKTRHRLSRVENISPVWTLPAEISDSRASLLVKETNIPRRISEGEFSHRLAGRPSMSACAEVVKSVDGGHSPAMTAWGDGAWTAGLVLAQALTGGLPT